LEKESVVILGAGNIGRGLMARLATLTGYVPVMVDADAQFVEKLRSAGSYDVRLTAKSEKTVAVSGYRVLSTAETREIDQAVADAAFAATAVGGAHLDEVGPSLARGIARRNRPLNILICENWPRADTILRETLLKAGCSETQFACVPCSVESMARGTSALLTVLSEADEPVYADETAWRGPIPPIEGLQFTTSLEAYYARKLYTNNAGHAVLAYLGWLAECDFIHEALGVATIRDTLDELLGVAAKALVAEYALSKAEMRAHIGRLVTVRYANRRLADPIVRVARDPLRKLGPNERLMGLIRLLEKHDLPTETVSRVIGAALHYREPDDAESMTMQEIIDRSGGGGVLETICGMDVQEPVYAECLGYYERFASARGAEIN